MGPPLQAEGWGQLLAGVERERLSGLLVQAISDGAFPATTAQADEARELHRASVYRSLALEAVLVGVVDLFSSAGIDVRVLKGPAVAHLDYPSPTLRSFVDIDLLVRSEDFDRAAAVLTESGEGRLHPELRRGFDRRFGKGATFSTWGEFEIDLHRTLDRGPFGLALSLPDLWSGWSSFELAGRPVRALAPAQRFLNACFHAALGNLPPRLVPVRDVAQMLSQGRLDLDQVLSLASSWRAEVVLARAVLLASGTLGLDRQHAMCEWASRYRPRPWEARTLRLYVDPRRNELARTMGTLRFIHGAADKVAYLGAVAWPSRSYLAERRRGRADHWRRAILPWRRRR